MQHQQDLNGRLDALAAVRGRALRQRCLGAWLCLRQAYALYRSSIATCRTAWRRRLLHGWRARTAWLASTRVQMQRGERMRSERLLLAGLAHWRYLHVSRSMRRVWQAALDKRRALLLAAKALRLWYFYAKRCRLIIARASTSTGIVMQGAQAAGLRGLLDCVLLLVHAGQAGITQALLSMHTECCPAAAVCVSCQVMC